jgi:hypothetical protein
MDSDDNDNESEVFLLRVPLGDDEVEGCFVMGILMVNEAANNICKYARDRTVALDS